MLGKKLRQFLGSGEKKAAVFVDGPNLLRKELGVNLEMIKKEAQKFGTYLGMELAKQAGGKPARGEPIWTQGKPATFKDRVGEAVFGKVLWTYLKAKPR